MPSYIQAGKFKAQCLKLMEDVQHKNTSIVITKRNVPVAKLVPFEEKSISFFGKMKDSVRFIGNIIDPIEENWDAHS